MSVMNKKTPLSIFDDQGANELKERQRLEELQRQAKVQRVKLDKRLNKQKILMGAFLGQILVTKGSDEQMIREYFAIHFPDFLTRKSDKELFKSMIEGLGGDMDLGNKEKQFEDNVQKINQGAINESSSAEDSKAINNQQLSSDTATHYGEQDSLLDDNSYSAYESNQDYRG